MSKPADDLAPRISRQVVKLRERTLLDGAMATSALVAMADRRLMLEESLALGAVLENVELLRIHDPELAVAIHSEFVEQMREDYDAGRQQAFSAIRRCADDLEAAELLVKVGIAIAKADSDFAPEEVDMVRDICACLGISGLDPTGMVGSLRGPRRPH